MPLWCIQSNASTVTKYPGGTPQKEGRRLSGPTSIYLIPTYYYVTGNTKKKLLQVFWMSNIGHKTRSNEKKVLFNRCTFIEKEVLVLYFG